MTKCGGMASGSMSVDQFHGLWSGSLVTPCLLLLGFDTLVAHTPVP